MTPDEYCQNKAAQSGSSFYYAFLFLPPEKRRAITALYAFCREVDDVVDEISEASVARMKLVWWREQVGILFAGQVNTHPVMQALAPHIAVYDLQQSELLAVIDGMEMDLDEVRYEHWEDLKSYCWHVASVVGILSAKIFGQRDPATRIYAEKLGLAFQLTNIIRDIGDDARRGRIYLPIRELEQFNVKPADIFDAHHTPEFEALMAFQTQRAYALYKDAMAALPEVDRRDQRPGLLMTAIYYALLQEIERDRWPVLEHRVSLTPIRKLWLAWRTWVSGGKGLIKRLQQ